MWEKQISNGKLYYIPIPINKTRFQKYFTLIPLPVIRAVTGTNPETRPNTDRLWVRALKRTLWR